METKEIEKQFKTIIEHLTDNIWIKTKVTRFNNRLKLEVYSTHNFLVLNSDLLEELSNLGFYHLEYTEDKYIFTFQLD